MFIESDDIRLFYEKTGDGPPLIMLHGNGETHHIFDEAAGALRSHFTVYTVDTRGHGLSFPVLEYHYDDMAQDIYRFITQLGIKKPLLYGFSDGGIVGLLLAIRYPGLLSQLAASGANTEPAGIKKSWLLLFRLIYAVSRSPQMKLMLSEPHITADDLRTISTPTLLTAGSRDMISDAHTRMIHESIPGSELIVVRGATHSSYIVHSKEIAKLLIDRFKEQASSSSRS